MRPGFVSRIFPLTLSVLFVGISTNNAHAYLDAGTGSMILQVVLGGVAGLAIAGRLYWHKFLSLFGIEPRKSEPDQSEPERPIEGPGRR
ncbi:hypothetical protein [Nitratireductor luteus]|uniref:hypothetical protein n=1 Tax=Nitratireductor luteus TaxID=2976980 RepID=UPI002240A563|nr:hypothetical protein [Nitratireductor luteus]